MSAHGRAADDQGVTHVPSPRAARVLVALGLAGFAAAVVGLWRGAPLVSCWFYVAAWWSYIVAADGVVHLRTGRSILLGRASTFALLAAWSAFFWLVFELVNLRLENWYYVGIPGTLIEKRVGAFVSFATVLPGVFETADLLRAFGVFERARCRPWRITQGLRVALVVVGVAFLVLPLAFPRYAYPLIWGATALIAEPILSRFGQRGLLASFERGDPRPALRLLAAGFVTGGLWESWNFHAEAKWIYTVPFFEETKLFEMPILGFLGFPPFALECWSFASVLVALGLVPEWEDEPTDLAAAPTATASRFRPLRAWIAVCLSVAACVPMIDAMLARTVRSEMAWIDDVPDLTPTARRTLIEHDVTTVRRWQRARATHTAPDLSRVATREQIERWERAVDLMSVKGLAHRGRVWLEQVGIVDVEALARAGDVELLERFRTSPGGPAPFPTGPEVRVWIRGARAALADR